MKVQDYSVWKNFSNAFMNVWKQYGPRASVIDHGKWNFKNQLQTYKIILKNALFLAWRWSYKISAFGSKNENVIFQRVGVGDTTVWKIFSYVFMNVSKQYGSRASVIHHEKWNFKNPLQTNEITFKNALYVAWRWRYKIIAFASKNENFIFQRVGLGDTCVWKTISHAFMIVSKEYGARARVIEKGKWNLNHHYKQTKLR